MFEWFKDKFKKKEDEVKEELQEVKDEISSEDNQEEELEEIHEKLEKVSEEGNLSEEVLEASEDIEDTNEKFQDKEVIEEAIEKKTEEKEEIKEEIKEEDKNLEEIHEKLEEVSEEGNLSEEDLKTSEDIEDTNEKFQDKEVIEEAIENKTEEKEVNNLEENSENLEEELEEITEAPKKASLFQRLKDGLDKTRKEVGIKINTVLGAYVKIDDEMLEDLEDILVSADVGMETTMKLIDNLRETIIREKVNDPKEVKPLLLKEAKKLMNPKLNTKINSDPPAIILVVGVNGVGKTTTIGKLSQRFKNENKSVLVCAADTFRAAAIDQLKEWGIRANVDVISHDEGSDPAAVVFDAIEAAKARNTDVLIVDTAGRLHNKSNLMKELEKINRIITQKYPEANRENLLVLDSTTGQNAINQAKTFKEVTDISAIALTKLDGTAKGGVVIALQSELGIPIKLIGVGEGIEDLQDFNIDTFLDTIFG
ncbi:signal recognition particle-docking protein FtsY [Peptoniphilus sp. HMSC062D09]|uniref:signal recognition particle-docking protein FtsY n=1 Tax=Peptoniphilus TaxID=162289 RepID=UPI0008A22544|nr:signal recognition particle-docking protein FtsY [Peptoniphilus sp. HMSC062D09]OFK78952.1 signal recognition particle-docking protein FtsY [Peptoniphilus sp. HMSC062D09]